MASYPKDQFDELPDELLRVGAHRGPAPKGRGWIAFAWAALATGVLVVGGIYGLSRIDQSYSFDLPFAGGETSAPNVPTPEPTVAVEPVTDPNTIPEREIVITVLNGTRTPGLESEAAGALTALAWNVGSTATASDNTIEETVVYYSNAEDEDVALGISQALGVGTIRLSDFFVGAKITIVLGSDYAAAE